MICSFLLAAFLTYCRVSGLDPTVSEDAVYGGGFRSIMPSGLKLGAPRPANSCQSLLHLGQQFDRDGLYRPALDTFRYYIETCHDESESWRVFNYMRAPVQVLSQSDNNQYDIHREWLKKVLHYEPDTMYYCEDVSAIMHTMQRNGDRGYDVNGMLSVARFIMETGRCPYLYNDWADGWKDARESQRLIYRDTVKDSTATPLDTNLVTLEELDLSILRGPSSVAEYQVPHSSEMTIRVGENPFSDRLSLHLTFGRRELVFVKIYTVLGDEVYSNGIGQVFEPGKQEVLIDGAMLPPGVLYVRCSTLDGPTKTVQVLRGR